MGNIRIFPCAGITETERTMMIEKRLFVCKMLSISAGIVGTAAYVRPVEQYATTDYFGIFLPAFITGYIIINSSEIFAMYIDEPHTFLEVCFAVIGSLGNGLCCIYQFCFHIDWPTIFYANNSTHSRNTRKLIVGLACLVNSIALILVANIRGVQKCFSRLSRNVEN